MSHPDVLNIRAFVPAKEYESARRFYADLGFTEIWTSPELSLFTMGSLSFYLQNFYVEVAANNFMMQLTTGNLDEWWTHLQSLDLASRYEGVRMKPPTHYPWGLREIHLIDPSGVLWHITER